MSKLPTTYVKNYVSGLLKTYGHSCPVMSRLINVGPSAGVINEQTDMKKKCPFLKDESTAKAVKEVSNEIKEDVIEPKTNTGTKLLFIFLTFYLSTKYENILKQSMNIELIFITLMFII